MQPTYNAQQTGENLYHGSQLPPVVSAASTPPQPSPTPLADQGAVVWDASEYIHHEKGFLWVLGLVVVTIIAVAIALLLGQLFFAVLIVLMGVVFGYYGLRKPLTMHYRLTRTDLTIGPRAYPLTAFRSFGVVAEGSVFSIRLIPTKRFGLTVFIYFAEQDGEKIVDILGAQLPMEDMQPDPVERLMHKLRF